MSTKKNNNNKIKQDKAVKPTLNPIADSICSFLEEDGWQIITFEEKQQSS